VTIRGAECGEEDLKLISSRKGAGYGLPFGCGAEQSMQWRTAAESAEYARIFKVASGGEGKQNKPGLCTDI
jgi:hypothetical protein